MSKPQDEYIKILYKINDTYSRYDIDANYDILDEINEFESKTNYSDKDLILLETKCFDEWYKLISKICKKSVDFIESKKILEEKLIKEKKKLKKIQAKLSMSITLPQYDEIYNDLSEILDDMKITEKAIKRNKKDRMKDIIVSLFFGSIITIILTIAFTQ